MCIVPFCMVVVWVVGECCMGMGWDGLGWSLLWHVGFGVSGVVMIKGVREGVLFWVRSGVYRY